MQPQSLGADNTYSAKFGAPVTVPATGGTEQASRAKSSTPLLRSTIHDVDRVLGLLQAVEPFLADQWTHTFRKPKPCIFAVCVREGDDFTDYVPICTSHGWIGAESDTRDEARAQECEKAKLELQAYGRMSWLMRSRFVVVETGSPQELQS